MDYFSKVVTGLTSDEKAKQEIKKRDDLINKLKDKIQKI